MSIFKFKSRSTLKRERDYYKDRFEEESKRCDQYRTEAVDAEFDKKKLQEDNDRLVKENKKLQEENLAKLNIINDDRHKHNKEKTKLQKRIDTLESELRTRNESQVGGGMRKGFVFDDRDEDNYGHKMPEE